MSTALPVDSIGVKLSTGNFVASPVISVPEGGGPGTGVIVPAFFAHSSLRVGCAVGPVGVVTWV